MSCCNSEVRDCLLWLIKFRINFKQNHDQAYAGESSKFPIISSVRNNK